MIRRTTVLLLCLTCCCFPAMWTVAARGISPAQARALSADCEATLLDLNNTISDGYFHQGKFLESVVALKRMIQLCPVGIEPYSDAAWLLWSSKKTDEAIALYRQMLAANPNDANGYFEFGMFYVNRKLDADALPLLAKAVQIGGLQRERRDLYGIVLARLKHTDDAITFWKTVLAEDKDDPIAQRELKQLTTPGAK